MHRSPFTFTLFANLLLVVQLCAAAPPVNEKTSAFWSFQPVRRPALPSVEQSDWPRNGIDTFILAKLEAVDLPPSPPASKVALLRRVYYDLTGLPPTAAEVDTFLHDDSPTAFADVVDRLLASPHYGEKWGRHWLDLVHYAETNSYERDGKKPFVHRYRDYVIRCLNDDKPYDQFVREQIAGDELDEVTADSITATGYYRIGIWQDEPVDPQQELFEDLDDISRTTSEVFLGLTLGCARCHDHKLDPVPQRDYYRFVAFFRNVRRYGVRSPDTITDSSVRPVDTTPNHEERQFVVATYERQLERYGKSLKDIESKIVDKLTGVEKDDFQYEANRLPILEKYVGNGLDVSHLRNYKEFIELRQQLLDNLPANKSYVLCVKEHGSQAPPTYVLARGNVHAPGELVEPGFPSVLGFPEPSISPPPTDAPTCQRRRALAEWIASAENPLTARVLVNRLWQYHFGRGLVRSPNDFGFQGMPPTHPRLLDWLASELVVGHWQLKRLHRLIMLSSTYQMSSQANEAGLAQDPENDSFWRFDIRRLTAEEIRDSILAVDGSLNRSMFGPGRFPRISDAVKAGQSKPGEGWDESTLGEQHRRSVYVHVKRSLILPLVKSFDGPDVDASCPVRFVTVQPTQSLAMMNGEFLNERASILASDVREVAGSSPRDQVATALVRALQRRPSDEEVAQGVELMDSLQREHGIDEDKALDYYCLVVLNLNEFMYLD